MIIEDFPRTENLDEPLIDFLADFEAYDPREKNSRNAQADKDLEAK